MAERHDSLAAELKPLAKGVLAELVSRRQTVATAESLTAGLVCATLTEVSGASAVVRGGLVVYATDLKAALADVDPDLLARHGAVHPEVAAQLAEGGRGRCGADWGSGSLASPVPRSRTASVRERCTSDSRAPRSGRCGRTGSKGTGRRSGPLRCGRRWSCSGNI